MIWRAQSTIYRDTIDLILIDDYGDQRHLAQPVEFAMKTIHRHEAIAEPTLALPRDSARSLFQALWDCGLRPNDGADSGAQVAALQRHILFAEQIARALLPRLAPGNEGDQS